MNTAPIMYKKMTLRELLEGEVELDLGLDANLTGIELDSRQVAHGDLFLACRGATHDGRDFIDTAIDAGAAAVLVEATEVVEAVEPAQQTRRVRGVPVVAIAGLSGRIGEFAARFFDQPAAALWLVGITGTNGKTSTCDFIAQLYSLLGVRCGISGTLGYGIYGESLSKSDSGPGTTPDPITVQRSLEAVRFSGATTMAMEVSSHGLRQKRVRTRDFDVAVFTNLSRDHLDYHGSMESYGEAKQKLFKGCKLKVAVVNLDDLFSITMLNSLSRQVRSYTYSLNNRRASVYAERIVHHPHGLQIDIVSPWGQWSLECGLLGSFNAGNLLAALTTVMASEKDKANFDPAAIMAAASKIQPVPGRMEVIGQGPLKVVVDYAHSPDGLETALKALREHYEGRIWCVFGCGGNRDQGKRPLMAAIAEQYADQVVVTDDNPRQEASAAIIKDILSGFSEPARVHVESDRAQAIGYAVDHAKPGDLVLIAGKGHEEYQDVGGNRMVFSDVRQARLCLNRRFGQAS